MKRSMYRIRLEWFVPFDPADLLTAVDVQGHIEAAQEFAQLKLVPAGGQMVNIQTKYFARREVPDAVAGSEPVSSSAPKPVEAGTRDDYVRPPRLPSTSEAPGETLMPPIPAAMKR